MEGRIRGMEEKLIRRIEKIYGQTKVVKTSQGYTEKFRTKKSVRQG